MCQQLPNLQELISLNFNNDRVVWSRFNKNVSLLTFHEFLKRSHCDENLQYILMTKPFVSNDKNLSLNRWNNIYLQFIRVDSPRECNFPEEIRLIFDDYYHESKLPSLNDIKISRKHILSLLQDAYNRFQERIKGGLSPCVCIPKNDSEYQYHLYGSSRSNEFALTDSSEEEQESIVRHTNTYLNTARSQNNMNSNMKTFVKTGSFSVHSLKLLNRSKKLVRKFKFCRSSNINHINCTNIANGGNAFI